eukprot:7842459-Pyramimonas_sp.AAC.1
MDAEIGVVVMVKRAPKTFLRAGTALGDSRLRTSSFSRWPSTRSSAPTAVSKLSEGELGRGGKRDG